MISGHWRNNIVPGGFSPKAKGRYFSWGDFFPGGIFTAEIFSRGGDIILGRFLLGGFFSGGLNGDFFWGDLYPVSNGTFNLQNHHILSNAP
jgi:hypothetical protein